MPALIDEAVTLVTETNKKASTSKLEQAGLIHDLARKKNGKSCHCIYKYQRKSLVNVNFLQSTAFMDISRMQLQN